MSTPPFSKYVAKRVSAARLSNSEDIFSERRVETWVGGEEGDAEGGGGGGGTLSFENVERDGYLGVTD